MPEMIRVINQQTPSTVTYELRTPCCSSEATTVMSTGHLALWCIAAP